MNSLREWVLPSKVESARDAFLLHRHANIQGVVDNLPRRERLGLKARLRVEAINANRRKDEFLATLSHELRTPLASIGYAVRVLDALKSETPDRQKMQALIQRQLQRITRLADDLLDVARIANGQLRLQTSRVDLSCVVRNAIETLQHDITARGHLFTVLTPDSPVWVQADPARLEQVFVNLIANAIKYTNPGGELSVSVHRAESTAVIRVRDSGIGIAAHALEGIFDLFKQVNAADPRSRSGLGVGLGVVRKLVALHDGTVTAVSRGLGEGSEFIVRLPLER